MQTRREINAYELDRTAGICFPVVREKVKVVQEFLPRPI
jgi:hypothetical protein